MKGKVKMSAIEDVNDRMTTYKKRKETLMRKMEEITTLCGIEASMILFNELEEGSELQTWPVNREAVQGVVEKFKSSSELDIGDRKHDMNSWAETMQQKEKLRQARLKLSIKEREGRKLTSDRLFSGRSVKDLSANDLSELHYVIDEKQRSLLARMRNLKKAEDAAGLEDTHDPDVYLNLDSPDGARHGMNVMGVYPSVAGNNNAQRE